MNKGFGALAIIIIIGILFIGGGSLYVYNKNLDIEKEKLNKEEESSQISVNNRIILEPTSTSQAFLKNTSSIDIISPNGGENLKAGEIISISFKLNSEKYVEEFISWFKKYGNIVWSNEQEVFMRNKFESPKNLEYVNIVLNSLKQKSNTNIQLYSPSYPSYPFDIKVPITGKINEYTVQVKIPFWVEPSDDYKLHISMGQGIEKDSNNNVIKSFPFIEDESDKSVAVVKHSIQLPSFTIVSPNGGEKLKSGSPYIIKWSGAIDKIDGYPTCLFFYLIHEIKDDPSSDDTPSNEIGKICREVSSSGSFTWDGYWEPYKEKGIPPEGKNYKILGVLSVRGQGFSTDILSDSSDTFFSIEK